ncbi:unannotated protein [freshwater metagenome]|uniref:Unannotated protein n=1 Tax=freshwater metagenome TaxID=449393 RepID=A0A6J7VBA4_9ZZZZ
MPTSVAVAIPGQEIKPALFVAEITSGLVFGETTKRAPALWARVTSALSTTVPTPTQTSARLAKDSMIEKAPGLVSVTSIQVSPASTMASAISWPVA